MAIKLSPYPSRRRFTSVKSVETFMKKEYPSSIEFEIDSQSINGTKKYWPVVVDVGSREVDSILRNGIEVDTSRYVFSEYAIPEITSIDWRR